MRHIYYIFASLFLIVCLSFNCNAQTNSNSIFVEDSVYMEAEIAPEFPGGLDAMFDFMRKNVNYPEEAREKNMEGTVIVNCIIEKDGTISNIKTYQSRGDLLDEEVIRVIRMMPKWSSGMNKGEVVRTMMYIPMRFTLTGKGKKKRK